MNSATRMLCEKYTDLSQAEIACIEQYNELLPALANAEEADVFIDCRTATGRSAIVVCEAKPITVPSSYSIPILGMLIQWKNEPAVDRSFRLGVPTVGVRAVQMPEDRRMVQTVEPIFCAEKLIGVLIYEKPAQAEVEPPRPTAECPEEQPDLDWSGVAQQLSDAVVFLDGEDAVCGYNRAAQKLYQDMGYISDIMGMEASNIRLGLSDDCDGQFREVSAVNRVLQYRRVRLPQGRAAAALVIRDVTERHRLEQELSQQRVALRELRHRMKNNLQMLADLIRVRGCELGGGGEGRAALLDTANRLLSLTATLDGEAQTQGEAVALLQMLERIRAYTLKTLLTPMGNISIQVSGDEVSVSPDRAASVALVVNELLQNALKHAFPAGGQGVVAIEVQRTPPLCKVSVADNGVGFGEEGGRPGGTGLELVRAVIRDRLIGEWDMETGPKGTRVSFDFLEK